MRHLWTSPAAAAAIAAAGSVAVWPFLAGGARQAVVVGAVLALSAHLAAHFLLRRWRARSDRFLAASLAGFAVRAAAVAAGVLVFALPRRTDPIPFLSSLGGFLIAMLIAESVIEYRRLRSGAVPAGS